MKFGRKLQLPCHCPNLEAGQATIIQHLGHLAAADAQQQVSADGFNLRLERIEHRLELTIASS